MDGVEQSAYDGFLKAEPLPTEQPFYERPSRFAELYLNSLSADDDPFFASRVFPRFPITEPPGSSARFEREDRHSRIDPPPIPVTGPIKYDVAWGPPTLFVSQRMYNTLDSSEYGRAIIAELNIKPTIPPSSRITITERERNGQ